LDERFSELTVIQPPWLAADRLPYLSDSIDLVLTDARSKSGGGDEARRVARNGVVSARQDDGSMDFSIEWLRGADFRQPSVSIVIPTCDGADLLEPCLSGLVDTVPRHLQAEFIVVDDGSTDETSSVVARWSSADDRVRLVRNAENLGFVDSCNRGAAEADGEALVFLNNDTLPIHGWLQPLIRTLFQDEGIGAVGGMLVYPNGTLQEAGAVVFSDGTGANFGKHDPEPDRPRYRFLRDVDYCSAALLTTRRATFERLAGFDTLFRPGYYEETDYCFRLREAGLRTVYQPESIIVHVEGATSGTDSFPREPKGHQAPNRVKFCERWSDALRSHPSRPTRFDEATWNQLGRHRPTMAKRSAG
jgi:GT2 family glycosyltransferase